MRNNARSSASSVDQPLPLPVHPRRSVVNARPSVDPWASEEEVVVNPEGSQQPLSFPAEVVKYLQTSLRNFVGDGLTSQRAPHYPFSWAELQNLERFRAKQMGGASSSSSSPPPFSAFSENIERRNMEELWTMILSVRNGPWKARIDSLECNVKRMLALWIKQRAQIQEAAGSMSEDASYEKLKRMQNEIIEKWGNRRLQARRGETYESTVKRRRLLSASEIEVSPALSSALSPGHGPEAAITRSSSASASGSAAKKSSRVAPVTENNNSSSPSASVSAAKTGSLVASETENKGRSFASAAKKRSTVAPLIENKASSSRSAAKKGLSDAQGIENNASSSGSAAKKGDASSSGSAAEKRFSKSALVETNTTQPASASRDSSAIKKSDETSSASKASASGSAAKKSRSNASSPLKDSPVVEEKDEEKPTVALDPVEEWMRARRERGERMGLR